MEVGFALINIKFKIPGRVALSLIFIQTLKKIKRGLSSFIIQKLSPLAQPF